MKSYMVGIKDSPHWPKVYQGPTPLACCWKFARDMGDLGSPDLYPEGCKIVAWTETNQDGCRRIDIQAELLMEDVAKDLALAVAQVYADRIEAERKNWRHVFGEFTTKEYKEARKKEQEAEEDAVDPGSLEGDSQAKIDMTRAFTLDEYIQAGDKYYGKYRATDVLRAGSKVEIYETFPGLLPRADKAAGRPELCVRLVTTVPNKLNLVVRRTWKRGEMAEVFEREKPDAES